MNKIKKTLLTLVALLTAVTGAWADQLASSYSSNATLNEVTVSASMEVTIATGVTVTINNGLNITSGTLTVKGPGTLVVNGKAGSNGYNSGPNNGGNGTPGAAAISGNIIVQGGATVKATGGNGGNGGNSGAEDGGKGAQGGAAITGEVTIQDASTLEATGGNGGKGGNGNRGDNGGGNGGVAFAGTLTYKGGTVTADGGNGGSGGWLDIDEEYGPSGSAGKAFTTSVNFVSSDYILTDGSNAITATQVTSKKKVVISPKVAVNSVTLAPTSATLTLDETETVTLTATVAPTNATDPTVKWSVTAGADKVKLYKDENCSTEVGTAATDVLTVYAKCLAVGEATVTVTSNDDATKTAACTVTVIPSGPEVAWDKAENSGTFKMPGGNVTLEPEYYPQATAAEGAVTAATDAKATTDAPLVTIDETKLTGATKMMYYVSTDATAPAYDAEGWTDKLPNAEGFTQQGIVYVWYYPVGTDEGVDGATATYSDGDICATALTVTIGAAPTYAVTFAEGTAEPTLWTASPATGVTKGQTVTVTYSGSKKVIGVKAEKKEEPAETTVTLTTGQIGNLSYGQQKTIGDITIALSGNAYFHATSMMDVSGDAGPEPDPNQVYAVGTFTFTSSAGKIKRIDINHNVGLWWGAGDGWPDSYEVYDNSTFTWSGTPAASVTLNGSQKGFEWCNLNEISSIVFTIEK